MGKGQRLTPPDQWNRDGPFRLNTRPRSVRHHTPTVVSPESHRSTSIPGLEVLRWDSGGGKEGEWWVCSEDLPGPAANGQRDIHA